MAARKTARRWGLAAALVGRLCVLQSCTYLQYRGDDALDMLEVGLTVTETPYWSGYFCVLSLANFGAGHIDGHVLGMGGGRVGWIRHYQKTAGTVLWSYEELGWGDEFDKDKPETLEYHHFGPTGWLKHPQRRPAYAPA